MSKSHTLNQAARSLQEAGIENPRFEARLLFAQALGVTPTQVLAGLHPEPTGEQSARFAHLLEERARRVPLAYLRGAQEFYGLTFAVSPAVLIPRPETELLVEFALEKLAERPSTVFADVGTGSGCIATAALAHHAGARAVAFDISADALMIARQNAIANGVSERLRFVQSSLLESAGEAVFDVIVANPPYIPTGEMESLQPEVRDFEPRLALDGGADGLDFLRQLAAGAARALRLCGWLAVEVARGQAEAVADLLRAAGLTSVETRRDLAGIARLAAGQKEIRSSGH